MLEFLNAIGPVTVTGLFGIILWRLQAADADRKANRAKSDERMARIEANTAKLADHDALIVSLSEIAKELKVATDQNSDGVKVLMRYMLQRYHATYMMRGFITSHEKQEFLEAYHVYHGKGGNGTGESWMRDVDGLPVRDDVPVINPYLEILKENKGEMK